MSERLGVDSATYQVLCECGDEKCMQRVDVPTGVFADVRDDHGQFVVAPGHERRGRDRVVAQAPAYSVVTFEPAFGAA